MEHFFAALWTVPPVVICVVTFILYRTMPYMLFFCIRRFPAQFMLFLLLIALNELVGIQADTQAWHMRAANHTTKVHLELFVPMPPTEYYLQQFQEMCLRSLLFFWPKQNVRLVIVTESTLTETGRNITDHLHGLLLHIAAWRLVVGPPNPFVMTGHNRQQWLMFWADSMSTAQYIGFVDTDTVFVSHVLYEDLFVQHRPRVQGILGEPLMEWWKKVPSGTWAATGFNESMKCMTYFPVIVKRHHLSLIRSHITEHMKTADFDGAFQRIVDRGGHSQFNIMCNVLYALVPASYHWHVNPFPSAEWQGSVPHQHPISSIPRQHLESVWPRVAIRYKYEIQLGTYYSIDEVMRAGYCYDVQTRYDRHLADCTSWLPNFYREVRNQPNIYAWRFESQDLRLPGAIEAHLARRKMLQSAPRFPWDVVEQGHLFRSYHTSRKDPLLPMQQPLDRLEAKVHGQLDRPETRSPPPILSRTPLQTARERGGGGGWGSSECRCLTHPTATVSCCGLGPCLLQGGQQPRRRRDGGQLRHPSIS